MAGQGQAAMLVARLDQVMAAAPADLPQAQAQEAELLELAAKLGALPLEEVKEALARRSPVAERLPVPQPRPLAPR